MWNTPDSNWVTVRREKGGEDLRVTGGMTESVTEVGMVRSLQGQLSMGKADV